ncbi:MAG: hypothetical protein PHP22_04720 [Oscillospiraceae bacterium]|nr:hypothetical protein [Oscillospiraceae bacterium]
MKDYSDIIRIEAELFGYRKACIRATIYLDRRLIAWNDSLQWNNNFLRSLTPDCIDKIYGQISKTGLLSWNGNYPESVSPSGAVAPEQWAVNVTFSDGTIFRSTGSKSFPLQWREFRDMIECAARVPFRLR